MYVPISAHGIAEEYDAKATPGCRAHGKNKQDVEDVSEAWGEGEKPEVLEDEGGFDEKYGEVVEKGLGEEELGQRQC